MDGPFGLLNWRGKADTQFLCEDLGSFFDSEELSRSYILNAFKKADEDMKGVSLTLLRRGERL